MPEGIASPPPTGADRGIFGDVAGWLVYGNDRGIWAVDPSRGSTSDRVLLSERRGEPIGWSSDGSRLLILAELSKATQGHPADRDLFVLKGDGTQTRLTNGPSWPSWPSGSISPDGSAVVFADDTGRGTDPGSGIFVVGTDGGPRRLILGAGERTYEDSTFTTGFGNPTFSPDGTRIAYFDGMGDWGNQLRVMNADGSGVARVLDEEVSHYANLAWSSDGGHLAFNGTGGGIWIVAVDGSGPVRLEGRGGHWSPTGSQLAYGAGAPSGADPWVPGPIWVIDADGSGRRQIAPVGNDPVWSPDGSRIAFKNEGSLYVVDVDGTHLRSLGSIKPHGGLTPDVLWVPL